MKNDQIIIHKKTRFMSVNYAFILPFDIVSEKQLNKNKEFYPQIKSDSQNNLTILRLKMFSILWIE